MPIRQFLDDERFDPETTRIMGVAFEMARVALKLGYGDALTARMAKRTIRDLAPRGRECRVLAPSRAFRTKPNSAYVITALAVAVVAARDVSCRFQ
jgi:hypothetical protein